MRTDRWAESLPTNCRQGISGTRSWDELAKAKGGKLFTVTDSLDLPVPAQRGDILAKAFLKAIEVLNQNKKGFFLMVEGSQLDDYGYFNDLDMLMQEVHDFDRTIGKVFEWVSTGWRNIGYCYRRSRKLEVPHPVDGNLAEGKDCAVLHRRTQWRDGSGVCLWSRCRTIYRYLRKFRYI